jgi:hypothetical protein
MIWWRGSGVDLEEDVDDAAVAEEADDGEKKEKNGRKMPDQGMLQL